MAKKKHDEVKAGLPGWMATYGDMVTLLLCFFVLLFSMSSVDITKFKAAISSFANQIDIMPGGTALIENDLITNGVTQLNDIELVFQNMMSVSKGDADDTGGQESDTANDNLDALQELLSEQEIAELARYTETGKVAEEVKDYLEDRGFYGAIEVSYNDNYVKLTIPGQTLFDSARAVLKPDALEMIDVIANMIRENNYLDYDIQVDGHTDNVPINNAEFADNWELSSRRALNVGRRLIDYSGFESSKMSMTGYGEYQPVDTNETVNGRARNRRVEIKIIIQTEEIKKEITPEETLTQP